MKHKRLARLVMFSEVAEKSSFSAAAKALGISKAYLSEQVKCLENEYAVPLLLRNTRNVRLTTEGRKAYECAIQIKQLSQGLEQNLSRLDGTIKITSPKLFAECYLSKIIAAFKKENKEVNFEIDTSYTKVDLFQADFDMAFRVTQRPLPENVVAKPLFNYRHVIVASPDYVASNPVINNLSDLKMHKCLLSEKTDIWHSEDTSVSLNASIQSNSNAVLKDLALRGDGIVKLPEYFVEKELAQQQLVPLVKLQDKELNTLFLLYPTTTRETARLRHFTDFVFAFFK